MNPNKLNAPDAYKECAGNGCSNLGRILLEIRYIKKRAYFCNSCAEDLLQNELATRQERNKLIIPQKPGSVNESPRKKGVRQTKSFGNVGGLITCKNKLIISILNRKAFGLDWKWSVKNGCR
jgi:hypothetical protein